MATVNTVLMWILKNPPEQHKLIQPMKMSTALFPRESAFAQALGSDTFSCRRISATASCHAHIQMLFQSGHRSKLLLKGRVHLTTKIPCASRHAL